RKAPPSHYTFKMQSFSLLSKASIEKCVSEEFEAGGYKWSLSIYPTGNTKGNGQGHVSIYLMLINTTSLPNDWEVNAIINFSAYNFKDNEYVTTQALDVSTLPANTKLVVDGTLRVKDQISGQHAQRKSFTISIRIIDHYRWTTI
ncbi:hypothetical protein RYX36_032133, partial [Vicia faba]